MNMFEEARAMSGTLRLCGLTQAELGERLGVSQSCVANKLRLLCYTEKEEREILRLGLSERHARAILRLDTPEERLSLIEKVDRMSLTVRETEALVDSQVIKQAPREIGRADRLSGIESFRTTLKKCADTLTSLGVPVTLTTGFWGDKMYITVCIEEI